MLVETHSIPKETAERVVRIATPQYALRSYQWAQSTMACVTRKLEGSRFSPGSRNNISYFFLHGLWGHVIEDARINTGFSDQQWCKLQNIYLEFYGLRLPANSRHVSVKILKAAKLLLSTQL
jgi:hypothetical protein